jgi:hypothetical protein
MQANGFVFSARYASTFFRENCSQRKMFFHLSGLGSNQLFAGRIGIHRRDRSLSMRSSHTVDRKRNSFFVQVHKIVDIATVRGTDKTPDLWVDLTDTLQSRCQPCILKYVHPEPCLRLSQSNLSYKLPAASRFQRSLDLVKLRKLERGTSVSIESRRQRCQLI